MHNENTKRSISLLKHAVMLFMVLCLNTVGFTATTFIFSSTAYAAEHDVEISLIYYDSAVDNGRTALNSNTPCSKHYESSSELSETLTLQINYEANDLEADIAPGELTFKVYGLEQFGLTSPSIAGNLFTSTHVKGTYNPETNLVEGDYWVFANKNTISSSGAVDGMVQMVYAVGKNSAKSPIDGSSGTAYVDYNGTISNQLHFDFSMEKNPFSGSITPYKISQISRFENGEDYYWVRYSVNASSSSTKVLKAPLDETYYYIIDLPEGCEMYYSQDTSGRSNRIIGPTFYKVEPISTENGTSTYKITTSQVSNGTAQIFVGYPKTDFNAGDQVRLTTNHYGRYYKKYTSYNEESGLMQEDNDSLLRQSTSNTYKLVDFIPPAPGDLYSWTYNVGTGYDSLTPSLISSDTKVTCYGSDSSTISIYNEAPVTIVYGWDQTVGISDFNGGYTLLSGTDALLSNKYGPYYMSRITDLNGVNLPAGTCEIELWIKEYGQDDYTLVATNTNQDSWKNYSVGTKQITGYYWKIKDLPAGEWTINRQNTLQTGKVHAELGTYDVDGKVFDSTYMMIYDQDDNCLTTPTSEMQYPESLQQAGVPERDLELYGTYMNRRVVYHNITPDKYYGNGGLLDTMFNKKQQGYTDYVINIFAGIGSNNGASNITGYDMYVDFPVICTWHASDIKGTTEKYKPYLVGNGKVPGYSTTTAYSLTTTVGDREAWVNDYLERAVIEKQSNIDGNGTNRLHIHFDYDEMLDITSITGKVWSFFIPIRVYDTDVLDYGGAVSSLLLHKPTFPDSSTITYVNGATMQTITGVQMYNISAEVSTGYTNTDTGDVDEDGDTTEIFYRAKGSGNLMTAFDAEQELSKLVQTDHDYFKTGAAWVSSDGGYVYRLRARSAATGMTNLVMYEHLEDYNPAGLPEHWHGAFADIDLTRSEAQGHVPTIYYSPSSTAGSLDEDDSWLPWDRNVDTRTVKSLAFDYGDQLIQPNSVISVDVVMHAPNENDGTYTYNTYSATWNRVDMASEHVFEDSETMESKTTILALDNPISDTKNITITKQWQDETEGQPYRPTTAVFTVTQDGELYGTPVAVTEGSNWRTTIAGLPCFDDFGHEFVYDVEETPIEHYQTNKSQDGDNFTFTNKFIANPELAVTKSTTAESAVIGDTINYTIEITNTGNVTLSNLLINDALVGFTNEPVIDSLAPGESTTKTCSYTPVKESDAIAGSVSNTATISATYPSSDTPYTATSNTVTTPVTASPAITIIKSGPVSSGTAHPDDPVTWSFTIKNTGDITLSDIAIQDELLSRRNISITGLPSTLAPNAEATVSADMPLTQADVDAGSVTNTATVSGKNPIDSSTVISDPSEATVQITKAPAISITKSVTENSIGIGGTIHYTLTVTNTGNTTLSNVTVNDALAGVSNVKVADTLAPGATATNECTYGPVTEADAIATSVSNTATVSAASPGTEDPVEAASNTVTTPVTASPAITISKTGPAQMNNAHKDDTLTWAFTVKNTGDITLSDIAIQDELLTARNVSVTGLPATLAPGASVDVTAVMPLTQADIDAGSVTNTATASGTNPVGSSTVTSQPDSATTTFTRNPAISVVKTANVESTSIGSTIEYTIKITNTGNVTLSNVTYDDPLTGKSSEAAADTLAPGAFVTKTCSYGPVTEADAVAKSVTNIATVHADDPTGTAIEPVNGSVTTPVTAAPGISIVKSVSPETAENAVADDTEVTWSFKVKNTGDVTLSDIAIQDEMLTARNISIPAITAPIAPGGEKTVSATMKLTQADIDAGFVTNSAKATGKEPVGNTTVESTPSEATVQISRSPAISIVKSATERSVGIDGTVHYILTVTNTGNVTLTDVMVNDTFAGVSNVKVADSLAPGATATKECSYGPATEADAIAGSVSNTATVSATAPGTDEPIAATSNTVITPVNAAPAITIDKSGPEAMNDAHKDDTLTWTFKVKNTGDITLSDIAIQDELLSSRNITISGLPATLAPNAEATVSADMPLTQADIDAGTITNTATVSGKNPVDSENVVSDPDSATTTFAHNSAISIDKTTTAESAAIGDTITYSIKVTNTGNCTLANVTYTDPLTNKRSEPVAETLAPGESKTVQCSYGPVTETDAIATKVTNTATANATDPSGIKDPDPVSDSVDTPVTAAPAISITKSVSPTTVTAAQVGSEAEWSFTIKNTGDITLSDIAIQDALLTSRNITIPTVSGTLAPGAEKTVTATMPLTQADINAGSVVNTAKVSAKEPVSDASIESEPSSATVQIEQTPSLDVTKVADKQDAKIGDAITYTITVTNTGNVTLAPVTIDDRLLEKTNYQVAESLAPGASESVELSYGPVTEEDAISGRVINTATAHGTVPPNAPSCEDKEATATTTVTPNPSIAIEKSVEPTLIDPAHAGDAVTWSITVRNTGDITLTDITVDDPYLTALGKDVVLSATTLAPNATATASIPATVSQAEVDAGSATNTATATGTVPSGKKAAQTVTSDPASATVLLARHPALTLAKSVDKANANIGDTLNYTIVITNTGNVTLSGVKINDALLGKNNEDLGNLAPGASTTVNGSYGPLTETDAQAHTVVNTATASASAPEGADDPESPSGTATTQIATHPAIKFVKTSDPTNIERAASGASITWSFDVENTGDITLNAISVADQYLEGKGATISFDKTTIAPGETAHGTATTTVSQAEIDSGSILNAATASAKDAAYGTEVSDDDTAQVVLGRGAALSLTETVDKSNAHIGDSLNYTIVITNTGNVTLSNVKLDFPLLGITNEDVPGNMTPGDTVTITKQYAKVTEADAIATTVVAPAAARATAPAGVDAPQEATDSVSTAILSAPGISLAKGVNPGEISNAQANTEVSWTFEVENTGDITLSGAMIEDALLSDRNSAVTLDRATLAPGEKAHATVAMPLTQADIDAGYVTNTATAKATEPVGSTSVSSTPAVATVRIVANSAMTAEKTVDKDNANIGDELTYTIVVTNTGNTTLSNISLDDELVGAAGTSVAESLTPGQSATFTGTYKVVEADAVAGTVTNKASVSAKPPAGDDMQIESNEVETAIASAPSIEVSKTSDKQNVDPAEVGSEIAYTFEVKNTGDVTLSGIQISDEMLKEAGVEIPIDEEMELAAGETKSVTARYRLTQADIDAGSVTNTATVSAKSATGKDIESEPSSVTVKLAQSPLLAMEKNVDATQITDAIGGEKLTFTFKITNTGNTTLTDVKAIDEMAGLSDIKVTWPNPDKPGELAPGESAIASADYAITAEDISRGRVENIAHAAGLIEGSVPVTSGVSSVLVEISPKAEAPQPIISTGDGSLYLVLVTVLAWAGAGAGMIYRRRRR